MPSTVALCASARRRLVTCRHSSPADSAVHLSAMIGPASARMQYAGMSSAWPVNAEKRDGGSNGDVASCCRSRRARKLVIAVHEYEYCTRTQGPFGVIVCRTHGETGPEPRPRLGPRRRRAAAGRHLAAGRRTGGGGDGGGDGGGKGGEGGGKGGGWPSTALTTAASINAMYQCLYA